MTAAVASQKEAVPAARTAPVLLSEESTLMDAITTPEFRYGGSVGDRIFAAGAVQTPAAPEQVETPTPAQVAAFDELTRIVGDSPERAARALELIKQDQAAQVLDCDELNNECETHEIDHGDLIHRGPQHKVSIGNDEDLLTHRLIRWGDNAPAIEYVDGGNWSELDIAAADAVMEATARQLASFLDTRTHLAAATGASGTGLPKELVTSLARVACATVAASLAGLQTNPHDVADRMHRTIDNAQGWHLAKVGGHSEVQAYATSRMSTAIHAMGDAVGASERPGRMAEALRTALGMVVSERGVAPAAYVPPTDWDQAEVIATAGASDPILKAALYTPTDIDGSVTGPQVLAVYAGGSGTDDELDRAGALDLKAQLLAFLPKLDAMIDALPAKVAVEPPQQQKDQPGGQA